MVWVHPVHHHDGLPQLGCQNCLVSTIAFARCLFYRSSWSSSISTKNHDFDWIHWLLHKSTVWWIWLRINTVIRFTKVDSQRLFWFCLRTYLDLNTRLHPATKNLSTHFGEFTVPRIKTETALTTTNANQLATVPKDLDLYRQAIEAGRQTLVDERSKAAAARVIFKILSNECRDVVLQAFIEGADITHKGSPTYYYNITRKLKRQKLSINWTYWQTPVT